MGAFKTQPRRARVFLGVLLAPITGVLILVCLARKQLSGTTTASDENRSHDMHSLTLFSKATEAEKSVEYWKNTGMERLQKQVPLIEVARISLPAIKGSYGSTRRCFY
jgi:hypothetical protein